MNPLLVTMAAAFPTAGGILVFQQIVPQAIGASSIALEAHALANMAASPKRAPSGWRLMQE